MLGLRMATSQVWLKNVSAFVNKRCSALAVRPYRSFLLELGASENNDTDIPYACTHCGFCI